MLSDADLRSSWYCLMTISLLQWLSIVVATPTLDELPVCRNYQACTARLRTFPLLSESIGAIVDEISAGGDINEAGSGEEASGVDETSIYDELVGSPPSPFDFYAESQRSEKRMCRCEGETDDEPTCNDEDANTMNVDVTLSLTFCKPIHDITKFKCVGRRNELRVMGQIHETGEALTSVDDTAAFCTCDSGSFKRTRIESWLNNYVFVYKCA